MRSPSPSRLLVLCHARSLFILGFLALGFAAAGNSLAAEAKLEVKKGDHVCLIGNTLADRMQHDGWLEAYLQSRFPEKDLTIRDLGFSADELNIRPRNDNFGDADKHLAFSKADVIFAFFGYNESFGGEAGLPAFRQQLAQFIDHTLAQKYNGASAPRLVLFSPIAHEDLQNPLLPDGKENNARLELYTKAMAEVAAEKHIPFVDLFHPTEELYAKAAEPLTINGIHLTENGDRALADVIDKSLFGTPPARSEAQMARLREAILDKNRRWYNRYRVTDGYNVYGGRSGTGNYDGQTNFTISRRELEIVDVQTANRDRRIWAIAKGGDMKVDDSNAPPALTIHTNKRGPNPDGSFPFLSGEDAIKQMTIHSGMKVNLFADEKMFPEVANPVQSSVDADGRLWVAVWPSYPHWQPNEEFRDKLLILEDTNGDGVADKCITFADKLHNPTGFEFWGGGVLIAQSPDLLFLKDTDGDGKADVRVRVMQGIDSADTHHTANSFVIDPDGCLCFQSGIFQVFGIESPWGKPLRTANTGVYRFNPLTYRSEHYYSVGPNPHGDVIDRWGNQFCTDGTTGRGFHIGFPYHGEPKQLFVMQYRPVPGIGLISGSHFPNELQGNLLVANAIGFQGVAQYKFNNDGATYHAEPVQPILYSKDPNFRPTSARIGGDGALYITDWQNPLIGHLQHNLRDPNRDHAHGRIYRVTVDGRPLRVPVKMRGKPIDEVVAQLASNDADIRYRARLELTGRNRTEAAASAAKLAATLDPAKPESAQTLVEALWVHSMLQIVNEPLLREVLALPEPNARAAATRTLRQWHDKIKEVGPLLVQLAADTDARVRAEAVITATYLKGPQAAEVVYMAEQFPQDLQLAFDLKEARKSINVDRLLKEGLENNAPLSNAAQIYMLRTAGVGVLMKLKPSEAIYQAILSRSDAKLKHLKYALAGLAAARKTTELKLLLDLLSEQDSKDEPGILTGVGTVLLSLPAKALRDERPRLVTIAQQGKSPLARQFAYAGWILADGSGNNAFAAASAKAEGLRDLLETVPLLRNDAASAGLYAQIHPLLYELPAAIRSAPGEGRLGAPGLSFDYFVPSPANAAIETFNKLTPKASGIASNVNIALPEVTQREGFALRFTGALSINQPGKYTFYLTSDDGSRLYLDAQNLIDNDGLHGGVEKSASVELTSGRHPLVVTYFNSGGQDSLALCWSGPGISEKQPIPREQFATGGGATLFELAVAALTSIPGHEAEKFKDLAAMVRADRARTSAISALQTLDPRDWDKGEVRPLIDALVDHLGRIPAKDRTSAAANEAFALTRKLATALPADVQKVVSARLRECEVCVVSISTVPERMIYNKDKLAVEAGRPVELRFSNADKMPHNLVLVQPGAMEEVGLLAESTAQTPDALQRQYVPKSDKIMFSSNLLQPDDMQAISFVAPKSPGLYPFICSFPGHWRRMYGALVVVENLSEYEARPAAYLAAHKVPIKDELLNDLGKGREWKIDDFVKSVRPLAAGRSYEVGLNAFKTSSCISCHKIGAVGLAIGPDLTKLEEKNRVPEAILHSVLTPSETIDPKYALQTFSLNSGKVVTAMVLEETPTTLTIIENPLANSKPRILTKAEIEERTKADKSLMPDGLLSKLTREEVLDLIAFIHAGGDPKNALFHGPGAHVHHHH